jgi:8-oxo-dGTP pyrophosphatase MutT (NUDIX family)
MVVSTSAQQLYPAATVVVVRDAIASDGTRSLETLMLRRNDRGTFGGMWVFPGGRVDPDDLDPDAPDDELAAGRRAAAREALEEAAVVIDPTSMVPLSHWRPPASVPKGYATWFFVAGGSDAVVEVDGTEIHDHAWLAPAEVLRRRDAGEVTLAPPTFVTLTTLAEHGSVAELVAAVRDISPERFHTQIGDAGGTATAFWHGDESYVESPGAAGSRHRLVMADGAWHYVRC